MEVISSYIFIKKTLKTAKHAVHFRFL